MPTHVGLAIGGGTTANAINVRLSSGNENMLGAERLLLGGGDSVATLTLAGVDAGNITSESNTEIVVEIADSTADTGAIVITSNTGAVVTTNDSAWEYLENGEIASITPAVGQFKVKFTIVGERLLGGGNSVASLTLVNVSATEVEANDTVITGFCGGAEEAATGDVGVRAKAFFPLFPYFSFFFWV